MKDVSLKEQIGRLNDQQREAVEHVDGPLLVVAGPGTGKTQLLSLRAANILDKRDVSPSNILCLTFSNAGAEAMRKRLTGLVGRIAYGIEIYTFHSFAESVRARYPEYFSRAASSSLVSDLRKKEILNSILQALPPNSAMFSLKNKEGVASKLSDAESFVGTFKRSGLTSDEYREILRQDIAFFDYAEGDEALMSLVNSSIPRKAEAKEEMCSSFEDEVVRVCSQAPEELKRPVVDTSGIYLPYAKWLSKTVSETELIDEDGKTTGFSGLRSKLFEGTAKDGRSFKDRNACERALAMLDVYDEYQSILSKQDLYDFDDMILEALDAISRSPKLQTALSEQYLYVQVDEFQDTNGAQMRLLELLEQGNPEPNLMAVCDDDQAIMRFQGAAVECITQFQERWNPHTVVLNTNYRSTPAIVELGKRVAEQVESRLAASASDKDVQAFKPQEGPDSFEELVCASKDAEYYAVASDVRRCLDSGFLETCEKPDEAIAILSPKHSKLRDLIPFLEAQDINFSYKQTSNVFKMESMQPLLSTMRFAAYTALGRKAMANMQVPFIVSSKEADLDDKTVLDIARIAKKECYGDWLCALEKSSDAKAVYLAKNLVDWASRAQSDPVRVLVLEMAKPSMMLCEANQIDDPWSLAEFNAGIRALVRFIEEELGQSLSASRALRLTDIVERMDEIARFGISIDATIALGDDASVRLMSAHGSKGLEFDRVYMLDADDSTWHKDASSSRMFPANMLVGNEEDEDDKRRLLFVALTRAKREIALYRAGGDMIRELVGEISTREIEPDSQEAADIIRVGWLGRYAASAESLRKNLIGDLRPSSLSVSMLNRFVKYDENTLDGEDFMESRLVRLPHEPSMSMEFGDVVHGFLEDYVNKVVKAGGSIEPLVETARKEISGLDFKEEEISSLYHRFDRILEGFLPQFDNMISGRLATEVKVECMTEEGVPIMGRCDLLSIDDEGRKIRVIDYKTGYSYPGPNPTVDYERQLDFYKLLIEGSDQFAGYEVIECCDLYVEPERGKPANAIKDAIASMPSTERLGHLRKLIKVVWDRLQEGRLDTTGFAGSDFEAQAIASNVKKDGTPKAHKDARLFQHAYEDWMIVEG